MNYVNPYRDSISTVQLSPFAEEQWNRIVTYSPIYVHWTDMLTMSRRRNNKSAVGKRNPVDQIDLNTMKLEDELLLNELYQMRRTAMPTRENASRPHPSTIVLEEQDHQTVSSDSFPETKESPKHNSSYVETSLTQQPNISKRSVMTSQTHYNQTNQFSHANLGPKPQPSLGVQLRQSMITRENALSANHERHIPSPLSMASSKRTISSAHSNQYQYRPLHSRLSSEMHSTSSHAQEPLSRSSTSLSRGKTRAKSTNSSRTAMHMLKTKNDRTRQKQNVELRTVLVEPWKQPLYTDGILDEAIPNSLEVMYQMCGPATPFERNLRYNFRRQLNQFRTGTIHH